jgi:hypothetical protein
MGISEICYERTYSKSSLAFSAITAGILFCLFQASPAFAGCPGDDTCPGELTALVQGANAVELKWIEPEGAVQGFFIVSMPSVTGEPIAVPPGNPNDWQDRIVYKLQPSTGYVFTVCSLPANSCVSTNTVTTLSAAAAATIAPSQGTSPGSGTPTPQITTLAAGTNYITLQWGAGVAYDFYQVGWTEIGPWAGETRQQSPQLNSGSTTSSWTIQGVLASEKYDVQVQGCFHGLFQSTCSGWADATITTQNPPPCPSDAKWDNVSGQCVIQAVVQSAPPLQAVVCGTSASPCTALPPAALKATVSGGEINVTWSIPSSLNAQIADATISRDPSWPNAMTTQKLATPNITSLNDVLAVTGVPYSYKVCLDYKQSPTVFQPASACASASAKVPCPSGEADNAKNQCVQNIPPVGATHLQVNVKLPITQDKPPIAAPRLQGNVKLPITQDKPPAPAKPSPVVETSKTPCPAGKVSTATGCK